MRIGDIDLSARTLIVAEIGNNHEGDFEVAKLLVQQAADAGADAVKFQTIRAEKLLALSEQDRIQRYKCYELSDAQFVELAQLAKSAGLLFLSTPFDVNSVDLLDELVPAFKVASGDLNNYPFLAHVARKGKPILLSTGMATEDEIAKALETIESTLSIPVAKQVVLLHCVSGYPTPIEQANLLSIPYLRDQFRVRIGYSDHTLGIAVSQAAVALGACVIEKHFTYRKENQSFRDHALSADPTEMKELVSNIRLIEGSLGEYDKRVMDCERDNRIEMRRSLAARKPISRGEIITEEAITFLRPATGISPEKLSSVIGRRVIRSIAEGAIIQEKDIE